MQLVDGWEVEAKVGSIIKGDDWRLSSRLIKGDGFSPLRYEVNSLGPIKSLACRIEITGRTVQYTPDGKTVRIKIVILGDCEPDTSFGGIMYV